MSLDTEKHRLPPTEGVVSGDDNDSNHGSEDDDSDEFGAGRISDRPDTSYLKAQEEDHHHHQATDKNLPTTTIPFKGIDNDTHEELRAMRQRRRSLSLDDEDFDEFGSGSDGDAPVLAYLQRMDSTDDLSVSEDIPNTQTLSNPPPTLTRNEALDANRHEDLGIVSRDNSFDENYDAFGDVHAGDRPVEAYLQRMDSADRDQPFLEDAQQVPDASQTVPSSSTSITTILPLTRNQGNLDNATHEDLGEIVATRSDASFDEDYDEFGDVNERDKPQPDYLKRMHSADDDDDELFEMALATVKNAGSSSNLDENQHEELAEMRKTRNDESFDKEFEEFGDATQKDQPVQAYLTRMDSTKDPNNFTSSSSSSFSQNLDHANHEDLADIVYGDHEPVGDSEEFVTANDQDQPSQKYLERQLSMDDDAFLED